MLGDDVANDALVRIYRAITPSGNQGFVGGAHLASIITGLAGIDTHLRGEGGSRNQRLVELIDKSDLEEDLKQELQALRKYRNKEVHVTEPRDDDALLESPGSMSQSWRRWRSGVQWSSSDHLHEPASMKGRRPSGCTGDAGSSRNRNHRSLAAS